MKETEKILKALANKRRLTIVNFLSKKGIADVGDIADEIRLSFKSTSKHLNILRSADLLDREQIGLSMFYSLSKPHSVILKSTLSIL